MKLYLEYLVEFSNRVVKEWYMLNDKKYSKQFFIYTIQLLSTIAKFFKFDIFKFKFKLFRIILLLDKSSNNKVERIISSEE